MSLGEPRHLNSNRKAALTVAALLATVATGVGVATAKDGGVTAPSPPKIKDARCLERCLDLRKVTETGLAELSGRNLEAIESVRLAGARGAIQVKARQTGPRLVRFKVPRGAVSGRPLAIDRFGNRSRSPVRLEIRPKDAISEAQGFAVTRTEATPAKSFYDGKQPSQVEYLFKAEQPADIRIDVLKGKRGRLVDTVVERNQEPNASHTATWDGLVESGRVAPNGNYRFEVSQISGGDSDRAKFRYYDHRFPLAGRHRYGDGLGAGRGHQGQDIFAKCGSPVYAARGGRVQVKDSHSAAGNYLVIDGRKTGVDYAYMHLERRGRPQQGAVVRTGERIGYASDTGRASGCHLHFEMWSAPGWYEGGHAIDPTKALKRWDRWS